jgi:ElaB/YqjD/DUF883 family membrane-anchored ribosome-binding protein
MANDTGSNGTTGTGLDLGSNPDNAAEERFIGANADTDNTGDKLRGATQLVKDEAGKYGGQATDKLRAFADDGKARATGVLDELARTIEGAAGTIDDKVGAQFGGYARTASTAVSDFSKKLGDKDVDDLVADAREFVKKSPGIAIGAAAALGFVLARVLRSGVDANRDN